MELQNIMVAYDASPQSEKALEWALKLAVFLHGNVSIVTVIKPPEFSSNMDELNGFYADGEKYYRPLLEQARQKGYAAGVEQVVTHFLYGHPAESIVRFAGNILLT